MEYNKVPIKEIKQQLGIDQNGIIRWKSRPSNRVNIGDIAGSIGNHMPIVYIVISICGVKIPAHRIAWVLYYGEWPDDQIDHINGNGLDNSKENLRSVNNQENQRNSKISSNNTSGFNGVSWSTRDRVWKSQIKVNYDVIHLGTFIDFTEAVWSRMKANTKYGFHERHGTRS